MRKCNENLRFSSSITIKKKFMVFSFFLPLFTKLKLFTGNVENLWWKAWVIRTICTAREYIFPRRWSKPSNGILAFHKTYIMIKVKWYSFGSNLNMFHLSRWDGSQNMISYASILFCRLILWSFSRVTVFFRTASTFAHAFLPLFNIKTRTKMIVTHHHRRSSLKKKNVKLTNSIEAITRPLK